MAAIVNPSMELLNLGPPVSATHLVALYQPDAQWFTEWIKGRFCRQKIFECGLDSSIHMIQPSTRPVHPRAIFARPSPDGGTPVPMFSRLGHLGVFRLFALTHRCHPCPPNRYLSIKGTSATIARSSGTWWLRCK